LRPLRQPWGSAISPCSRRSIWSNQRSQSNDGRYSACVRNVNEWIRLEKHEISELANLDSTFGAKCSLEFSRIAGGTLQRLHWGDARLHQLDELLMERRHTRTKWYVGSGHDPNPGLSHCAEHFGVLGPEPVLALDVSLTEPATLAVPCLMQGDQCGNLPG